MLRRQADPDRIAAVLAYAKEHGVRKAAKRFKLAERTVYAYRQRRDKQPALAAVCKAAEQKVIADWLTEAKAARSVLLARVLELAGKSDELRDVVGALKIVNDGTLAYEVVQPDGGRPVNGAGVALEGAEAPGAGSGCPAGTELN